MGNKTDSWDKESSRTEACMVCIDGDMEHEDLAHLPNGHLLEKIAWVALEVPNDRGMNS